VQYLFGAKIQFDSPGPPAVGLMQFVGEGMERLEIIQLTNSDIDIVKKWLYKEHVRKWFKEPEEWLKEISGREQNYSFIKHFIVFCQNEPIGFCQYYACSEADEEEYRSYPKEGTYSIDYCIGEESYLGKGYGQEIVERLVDLIWKIKESKLIVVQPERENTMSCNVLLKNGFMFDDVTKVYVLRKAN
jgi:RimJ/RimL family protein N-acetyltransferase